MDLVEVDPILFVTCRLCLDKIGMYQIVPHTRMLIKFCFDIDIEPFHLNHQGLPQVICKDCHRILSEYAGIKEIYTENQKSLSKLKNQQQDNNISSIQQADSASNSIPNVEPNTEELAHKSRTSSADRESCKGDPNQQQDNNISSIQQADSAFKSIPKLNVEPNAEELVQKSRTSSADRESCKGDPNQQQDNNISSIQQADSAFKSIPKLNVEPNAEELVQKSRTSSADRESCKGDPNQQQDNNISSIQQADSAFKGIPKLNVEPNAEELVQKSRTSSADRESCKGDPNQQQDNNISSIQQADSAFKGIPKLNVEPNAEELVQKSRTSSADRESCKGDPNQQQDNNISSIQQADSAFKGIPKLNVEPNTEELVQKSRTSSADRESCKGDPNQQQDNVSSAHQANIIKKNVMKRPRSLWKKDYIKHFVCRFCSKSYKEERSIIIHLKQCKLKVKYSNAVQSCSVELKRMGSRPNLTSSNENVVHRKDNIIHCINENYYVMYTLKSFDDKDFITTRNRKRRCLNSAGSNETLLIEGNSSNRNHN